MTPCEPILGWQDVSDKHLFETGKRMYMKGGEQTMKYLPWILALIAIWLIAAPFVLGYAQTEPAMHNDVGVGVVMLLGALIWGWSELRSQGFSADMHAQRR